MSAQALPCGCCRDCYACLCGGAALPPTLVAELAPGYASHAVTLCGGLDAYDYSFLRNQAATTLTLTLGRGLVACDYGGVVDLEVPVRAPFCSAGEFDTCAPPPGYTAVVRVGVTAQPCTRTLSGGVWSPATAGVVTAGAAVVQVLDPDGNPVPLPNCFPARLFLEGFYIDTPLFSLSGVATPSCSGGSVLMEYTFSGTDEYGTAYAVDLTVSD